jgi:hypothetical protein
MSSLNKTFVICKKAYTMSLSFIQDVKFSKNTKHHKLTRDNGEDGEVNFFFLKMKFLINMKVILKLIHYSV